MDALPPILNGGLLYMMANREMPTSEEELKAAVQVEVLIPITGRKRARTDQQW